MATANKMIGYRPDPTERAILEAYKQRTGLPYARLIAMAVREKAEREGIQSQPSLDEDENEEADEDLITALRQGIADRDAGRVVTLDQVKANAEAALAARRSKTAR